MRVMNWRLAMKRTDTTMLVGLMLAGAGVMFLLLNLGILGAAASAFWALAFVVAAQRS
jgi:hypothetical protein